MTPRTARVRTPRGPWVALLHVLWRSPLYAIPFALFFGTLNGARSLDGYLGAYLISFVFAFVISLMMWATEHFVNPRFRARQAAGGGKAMATEIGLFAGASMIGALIAALIVHFTLVPGFLGSARNVATLGMFSLIFTVLFLAVFSALDFYQSTIAQAKSEQELHLARRIQRSFLLSQFPEMPRLEVHAVNVSSKQVSGDFYDVVPAGDNAFLVAIADVAGKGVPAALLSSMLQASLRTQAGSQASVAAILTSINGLVYRSTAVHQFATFFLARVEEDTLRLVFSNAGHNFPLLFRRGGGRRTLERGGTVVGIMEPCAFEEESLALEPGDRLLIYTDGISEAANAAGELFGEERIEALMTALPADLSAREITERVLGGVREFLDGIEPGDDMTVMVLRVLEGASRSAAAPFRDGAGTAAAVQPGA